MRHRPHCSLQQAQVCERKGLWACVFGWDGRTNVRMCTLLLGGDLKFRSNSLKAISRSGTNSHKFVSHFHAPFSWAVTVRSVRRLAMGWTVRESNFVVEIFCTRPDWPWEPPSLLYNLYRFSFLEVMQPGRGVDHPSLSSTDVPEAIVCPLAAVAGKWTARTCPVFSF